MSDRRHTRRDVLRLLSATIAGTVALNSGLVDKTVRTAHAFGEQGRTRIALLQYPGSNWHPYPRAIDTLLNEVDMTTSISTAKSEDTVRLEDGDLSAYPLVFVCGNTAFSPWSSNARKRLRRYIGAGGMLVFDSGDREADGGFRQSVERELQEILPDKKLARTPISHVLYKSFYLCRGNEGSVQIQDHTDSIIDEGRIQVLYIYNNLLGAYDRRSDTSRYAAGRRDRQRDFAYRLGVNLVMYALTLDYKEDQVHVPFILRRRRWTVP